MNTTRTSRGAPPARNPPPPGPGATTLQVDAVPGLPSPTSPDQSGGARVRYPLRLRGLVELLARHTRVNGSELGQLSDAELRAVSEQAVAMLEGHATALDTVTHMLAAISGPDEAPHPVALAMLLQLLSEHAQVAIEMGEAARLELDRRARN